MTVTWETIDKLVDFLKEKAESNDIYIWGAGTYGKTFGNLFCKKSIEWMGFIDNDIKKKNQVLCNKCIVTLNQIEIKENLVVVLSISPVMYQVAYNEIIQQLYDAGIKEKQIIRLSENLILAQRILVYDKQPEKYLKKLELLKGKFENRRAFVLGNGPSLQIKDLEKIDKEISFGCNTLIQVLGKTSWRPTCFFAEDTTFIAKYLNTKDEVEWMTQNCKILFTSIINNIYDNYRDEFNNIFFFYTKRDLENIKFEDDITRGIYAGGTSLYSILQIAVYLGIREIYLLGVDFSFKREVYKDGKVVVNEHVQNHMSEMNQVNEGTYYMDLILRGWLTAKEYAEQYGIKIYNATRGGKLEVFERVDFDTLF